MGKIKEFYNNHKKGVIVGGALVIGGTIVTAVACYFKRDDIAVAVSSFLLKMNHNETLNITSNYIEGSNCTREVNVSDYIRRLPVGYKASQHQIDLALSKGFVLESNCTYVNSYVRNVSYEV